MSTPKFNWRELVAGQQQPHLVLAEFTRTLDILISRDVFSVMTIDAAPEGDQIDFVGRNHIVGPTPTGAWAGKPYYIAMWLNSGGWRFFEPKVGMMMWDRGNVAMVVYTGRTAGPWEYLSS